MPDIEAPPIHQQAQTGEYITKFARRMETLYANQDALDEKFADMDDLKQRIRVATKGDGSDVKTLKSGIIGRQNKQEAGILHILPFTRFNPPTTSDKDLKHANMLEAVVAGAIQKSMKSGDSTRTVPNNGVRWGRAWEMTIADPSVYSGPEFKDQAQAIKDADDNSKEEAELKLEMMKRDQWPIQTTEVATRKTWTYFTGKNWLPEVIQIRKMTLDAIQAEWPNFSTERSRGTQEVEVLIYSNHKWIYTVIEKQIVHFFDHDMGMNPVTLGEFVRAPENDMNIRWQPSAYHAIEMAEALDETLSDWHTAQREATRSQIVFKMDKKEYDQNEMNAGRPKQETVTPGGPPIMLWDTEDLGRAPAAEMNDQAAFYLNFLYGMVTAEVKNPVEEGEFKSGSSGTLGMIATQLSERSRSAMVTALKDMHRDKTKLIMRAIVRVNRDFPSRVDKISVYDPRVTGKGFIEAGPDDVIGWEAGIQVRAEPAIPTERNLLLAQARQEKELGFDSEVYMGATLGHEDIPSIKVRRFREDMESVVQQQVLMPMLVSRVIASQQSLSDEEQQQSLDLATGSSQQLEQALASGRSAGQSASNTSRGAVPERPQGQGRI